MSDLELGASQERRRILAIILEESALHKLAGDERIAGALDAVAFKVTQDHREDSER